MALEGLALLCGHLAGDYLLQNDWQARNKTNPRPTEKPFIYTSRQGGMWQDGVNRWYIGHLACTVHCLLYTLAVWSFTWRWMPWWGLLACFLIHWPIDRFRLAREFMDHIGQREFTTGPLSPWSVIVVDNTLHLITLYAIGLIALT